ncbi:endonuclease [Spirochaetia bacterium]|nr:endonuclease [Spirochaetia bacterium]
MKITVKGLFIQAAVLVCLILPGCDTAAPESSGQADRGALQSLSIMSWNIQTFFDGEDEGTEYEEYRASAGWNGEKYQARLTALAQAIGKTGGQGPDILAFMEVENPQVLEDMARGELSKQGYNWTSFANNPGYSLGVGVLSRFPFTVTRSHSLTVNGETTPRPILEIWLTPQDKPLVLFICHWKSKLGGDDVTEPQRRASARVLQRRLAEIRRDEPGTPVVIMGDLNENHDEFYRRSGSEICALLPDDQKAAELVSLHTGPVDFLVTSREKPPKSVYVNMDAPPLYSPWGNELLEGTYNYKNTWETIDHFLMNDAFFDKTGWEFDTCRVLKVEPFVKSSGYPNGYNPRTGSGHSDHLPLLLKLKVF